MEENKEFNGAEKSTDGMNFIEENPQKSADMVSDSFFDKEFAETERKAEDNIKFEKNPENLIDMIRHSDIGKAVLGEDGILNTENVGRIAESARSAVKGAADKLKDLFRE